MGISGKGEATINSFRESEHVKKHNIYLIGSQPFAEYGKLKASFPALKSKMPSVPERVLPTVPNL